MSYGAGPRAVLSLQGGLGNQLFQWAFAASLVRDGVRLTLDTVRCRGSRPMALGTLAGDYRRVPRAAGLALVAAQRARALRGAVLPNLVTEERFGYDATVRERIVESGAPGSYLCGYFQSYRYFDDVAADVRGRVNAFLHGQLTPRGRAFHADVSADPSTVAVHVRRGDYVTNPTAAAYHGTLDADYYRAALRELAGRGHTRRIWFSDDPSWVMDNLAEPGDELCPADATEDAGGEIALMSACSARVIANSSFSWWAGWLGRAGTPVVAPKAWFANGKGGTGDLIPAEWQRL